VRRGEECSYWKGGHTSSYYRHLAFEVYGMEKKCEVVGCKNPTDLSYICVHHKDGNRDNNARDNLEIRCKSHHTGYHIEVGDIGWSIHNKKWIPRITLEEIQKELAEYNSMRMKALRAKDTKTLDKLKKKDAQMKTLQVKMSKPQLLLFPMTFIYLIIWPIIAGLYPSPVIYIPGFGPQVFYIWYLLCSLFFGTLASKIVGITQIQ